MKKLFAIAFTCVYLLLTVGVVKSTHYCMGRINSSPASREVTYSPSQHLTTAPEIILNESASYRAGFHENNRKNSAEFFIISDLYSEAFVILLA